MRATRIAWALALGLALVVTAGYGIVAYGGAPAPAPSYPQAVSNEPSLPGDLTTPWEDEPTISASDLERDNGTDAVTIGFAVRWGYLDDPAVAKMEGVWRWNDDRTGGAFHGRWVLMNRRLHGELEGRFTTPDDGRGVFRGTWNVSGSDRGGSLWGDWVRTERFHGFFDGRWNVTDGREGGALAGRWAQFREAGGGFTGIGIHAPTLGPVDWTGSLHASAGSVTLIRPIRWERDDAVRRVDRQTVGWTSTTTVNWDGLLFALRLPKDGNTTVALHTAQISFRWSLRELPGLHVRETVDRAGHEIEVRAFVLNREGGHEGDATKFGIGLRWGRLHANESDADARTDDATVWDGFAQLTSGGLMVEWIISFERGDYVLPRDNRLTVEWRSRTTTGWDGLVLVALVPTDRARDVHVTLHAGDFSHVFSLAELLGDHTFDVGDGNQVEVRGVRL